MIKPERIYDRTNQGLEIILYYYPQAREALENKKPFALRQEKTPSAWIKLIKGIYRVTDFGDDATAMSPIDIAMREEGLNFFQTIQVLAERYGIEQSYNVQVNKPDIRKAPATAEEPEGHFSFEAKESPDPHDLAILGPKVKKEHMQKYGYIALKSYSKTKNRETITVGSNEHYPILMRQCTTEKGQFYKIYQPCNPNKAFRFFYHGEKPKDYINGLEELKKAYAKKNSDAEDVSKPLDEVVICSGERDAINLVSYGYLPLWFNSETYNLSKKEYNDIAKYAAKIYNIPDIDSTGIKKGVELGMNHLTIYTVWLPDSLRNYKDMRGNPRKDLRDFIELNQSGYELSNLMRVAKPFQFWEAIKSDKGVRFEINTEYLLNFLYHNGFSTFEDKSGKDGVSFIKLNGNIVSEVTAQDIRNFIRGFAKDRYLDLNVQNLITNSKRVAESTFKDLPMRDIDFTSFDHARQFLFFQNQTWEVTGNDIIIHKNKEVDKYVWDDLVVKYNVKRHDPSFTITRINDDQFDISINDHSSNFFNYLTNASRVFWRDELEHRTSQWINGEDNYRSRFKFSIDGPLLTPEEVEEQKQHLINKIFTIGFLMHKYKTQSRAWSVFAMDNKIGELGQSNGGSGKSFCYKALRIFMKHVTLSGKDPKLTENKHIYERVTEHTDFILVDDTHRYLNFEFFFDSITGDLVVNPKNNRSYEIPFEDSPKFVLTSNYTVPDLDASKERRLLYAAFSDYYHQRTEENGYLETRTIRDDFGKDLMDKIYSEKEWIADINFLADCLQFYLSTMNSNIKIQPPMNRIAKRNNDAVMGENFKEWAEVYFSTEGDMLNEVIFKDRALADFKSETGSGNWSTRKFTKALKAFAKSCDWIESINPVEVLSPSGRIIKKDPLTGKTKEGFYLKQHGVDIPAHCITNTVAKNEDHKRF